MNLRRTFAIVLRHFYLVRGSFSRLVPMFVWVTIDVVLWGFMTRYLNAVTPARFDFIPALLGAVLLWDFFVRVMQGVTMAFFEDVWSRNFLNIFATPLSISEYLSGLVLSSIATSAIGLVVMVVLASVVFGLSFAAYGIMLGAFLLVLFLFGIAIGVFASALVLRMGPAGEWFIWPIPAVLSPFAAVFYPVSSLPKWMQAVSVALPPAHVFEGVRGIAKGTGASAAELAWAAALAAIYIGLACWLFQRVYRYALRSGLIAKFSAETVS